MTMRTFIEKLQAKGFVYDTDLAMYIKQNSSGRCEVSVVGESWRGFSVTLYEMPAAESRRSLKWIHGTYDFNGIPAYDKVAGAIQIQERLAQMV